MSINTQHQELVIRVLLADPDEGLLATYRVFLSRYGFEVATAANGVDCLLRFRAFKPDVLVLDPEMPWGPGDNALALMLEEDDVPRVPVLLLSADYDHVSRPAYSMHLAKPLAPELLAKRIRLLFECAPLPGGFLAREDVYRNLGIDKREVTSKEREGRACAERWIATA